jgi:hypothetical protein
MFSFFKSFEEKYPVINFFIVGVGGTALIIGILDGAFYFIGGNKLVDRLSLISILAGVGWLLPKFFKLSSSR